MEVLFDHKKKILSAIGLGLILYLTKKGKESKSNNAEPSLDNKSEVKANQKVSFYNKENRNGRHGFFEKSLEAY